ncbi:hypothetical protein RUM43_004741 [Polyplax serrata]|uniref:Ras GTPase-activating-like protein IQGAP1 n=1 Tax=Polyplax serrata TaxID=468196 RepID=A0AAN8SC12_POLSC
MNVESTLHKINSGKSNQEMDETRQSNSAYEYLCHLEEAKMQVWIESVLKEPLPPTINLEENLRNGVYLAKLGNFIAPDKVPLSRIYDIFQHRYRSSGLQFRHTDNINYWLEALKSIGFPKMFMVETTDVYDKKNMPKVIYCIHALSAYLFRSGQAPLIQSLFSKVQFSKQEIDSVCYDMKEKGIVIPAFQKIGGILTKESTNDMKTLHEEIINLNKAIDDESEENLSKVLNSRSTDFVQVIPEYITKYLDAFKQAKAEKIQAFQNRSLNKSYDPDVYDELLNQSEIQGHIRQVNIDCIWQDILNSIKKKKRENLKEIIAMSFNEIKDFKEQNIEFYIDEALALDVNNIKSNNSRDTIQTIVRNGNRNANESVRNAVIRVKQAILDRSKDKLLIALRSPSLKLSSHISDFAAPLYLEEMQEDLKMAKELTYKDIKSSVFVLNGIAKLTAAVDSRDCEATWRQLSNPDIPIMNIDAALKTQYFKALYACRQEKLLQKVDNCLLTFIDVQECVDLANTEDFEQTRALIYLEEINEAVRDSDVEKLFKGLQGIVPGQVSVEDSPLCMILLKKLLLKKQEKNDEELWLDDIKTIEQEIKKNKQKALRICEKLCDKYSANEAPDNVLRSIENYNSRKQVHAMNGVKKHNEIWMVYKMNGDLTLYINPASRKFVWFKPIETNGGKLQFRVVNDIQTSQENQNQNAFPRLNSKKKLEIMEQRIIKLQAIIRGYIVRRRVEKTLKAIIIIQRWWRATMHLKNEKNEALSLRLDHYNKNVDKIIKLQAMWRGYRYRRDNPRKYKRPRSPVDPSFNLLRHLVLSRQINSHDYSTDLKVQTMKSCVVETIKINQELTFKLDEMDMKIGLLVQNRMSVETIIAENKKLQMSHLGRNEGRGIKAFSKEAKRLLDGYQQLFYLLQTDPAYLTRLIVRLPSRLNHVIQSCVLSLFNYGSNSRDAYLLLRLFRSALYEEVQTKLQKPIEVITGNPLVLRLAVAFARQAEGHNPLRNILGFLIEKVLNDKVFIDTNPVDIYRRWVNQMETESGRASNLPQSVTPEQALSYPEVVCRLNHNIRILKSWVKCFLDRLSSCVNQFPYALRFIAKLLKNALLQKFPSTPEKDILKIVGNLVYYQYINSAIVAPDAFYTISLPANQPMKVEQRRNLASIAKILHFAAAKKGVRGRTLRFQVAQIEKPRIYITLEEIRECHRLLLEVRQEIAPDPMDVVHEILDDLGPPPSLAVLVGYNNSSDATLSRAGKMQVCLELDNTFQGPPEDPTDIEQLFIKTKELISSRLSYLHGETLAIAVKDPKHFDIATNLAKLELAGMVKSSDDYCDIVKSLLQDVSHKQEYRRLQNQEISVLRTAQQRLNEKRRFYEEQVAHYEQYLKTCLNNLTAPGNKTKFKKERSLKYSGTRLRDKGILISLDGVPPGQLKNVQFEISTTKFNGIYSIHGRFMGIEVEKIDIDIQELLKLQFEGLREMDLFGKAQINVNLLLHLLNKKFHART